MRIAHIHTLIDVGVRDTWELPKSRVRIDRRRFNKTLVPVLAELRAELGLPDGYVACEPSCIRS